MVNVYDIALETGEVIKLAFPNYAAKKYAREFYTGKDPKSVEDVMMDIATVFESFQELEKLGPVNSSLMLKTLDDVCVKIIPFFYCGVNAYKMINREAEDYTFDEAKRAISLMGMDQILLIVKAMQEACIPAGLPKETSEDKKKERKSVEAVKGKRAASKK